ncbi:hypothetical protein MTO96_008263 [Rhipicephalus appendiculatus]
MMPPRHRLPTAQELHRRQLPATAAPPLLRLLLQRVLWERPPQRLRKQPKEMQRRWLHLPRVGEISG